MVPDEFAARCSRTEVKVQRRRRLHRDESGMESLQAVGLTFLGLIIAVCLCKVFAVFRDNVKMQTEELIELNSSDQDEDEPRPVLLELEE